MPAENYKKWIVIGIVVLVAVIVAFAIMTGTPDRPRQSAVTSPQRTAPPSGPLVDINPNRFTPVEELGADMNDPAALAALGDRYFESNNYGQAIEIYKKVIELKPDDIDTYNDLGLAYHYTRQSELAVSALKKGTEVMPSYQRIWLSLGFVLISTGANDEAEAALKKAAELDPGSEIGREAVRMMGLIK